MVVLEDGAALVVVVADGAGGMAGGSSAADAVVAAVRAAMDDGSDLTSEATWARLMVSLDEELSSRSVGETTAIALVVSPTGVVGASVGDSAAWIIEGSHIDELTADQTKKRLGSGRAAPRTFFRAALRGVLVVGNEHHRVEVFNDLQDSGHGAAVHVEQVQDLLDLASVVIDRAVREIETQLKAIDDITKAARTIESKGGSIRETAEGLKEAVEEQLEILRENTSKLHAPSR